MINLLFKKYLTFDGRLNRKKYSIRNFFAAFISCFGILAMGYFFVAKMYVAYLFAILVTFFSSWFSYANMSKRLHDLGISGVFIIPFVILGLLGLVGYRNTFFTLIAVIFGIALLFIKGNAGKNKYGPDPLEEINNERKSYNPTSASNAGANTQNMISDFLSTNINIAKIISVFLLLSVFQLEKFNNGLFDVFRLNPNGLYTMLKILITSFSLWSVHNYVERKRRLGIWVFSFIAILFNPIIKISFTSDIWATIDFATALVFIISLYLDYKSGIHFS